MWERKPEPPRTRRGRRLIQCHDRSPHGSHHYIRGDEGVTCPGMRRDWWRT